MNSLRIKLLGWYALVLGGLGLGGALLLSLNVRRVVELEVDRRLGRIANELRAGMTPLANGKFGVDLDSTLVETFSSETEETPYYRIWNTSGDLVDTSHPDLKIPLPAKDASRNREAYRELTLAGPSDSLILVGQNTDREREHVRNLLLSSLLGVAFAVVVLLVGAWFLTGRALVPIRRMTRAAAKISAVNPDERIDVSRMETELEELAHTINLAFDRLSAALEQQARFTAHASHELRTPLSIIRANADLSLLRERSGDDYRETLRTIQAATSRMDAIVDGLLTLARADRGVLNLKRELVPLHEIVADTCKLCEAFAARREVTLDVKLGPARIHGDEDRLGEAVANLLSNAILHNPPAQRVEVRLTTDGRHAVLTVRDYGVGVPESELERIFEPFYRLREHEANGAPGSGLGLAITRSIVAAHGGTIVCRLPDGPGSVFELTLPLVAGEHHVSEGGRPTVSATH